MEYEIEDEAGLFDCSTNPSLDRGNATTPRERPKTAKRPQRAEVIPDED